MRQKFLKIIIGLFIIAFIQVISISLVKLFKTAFPPSLLGMIIFSLLLYFKVIPMKLVKGTCDVLLDNMVLFFVPVTVGIILYTDMISKNLLVLGVVIALSTFTTLVASALIADYFVERKRGKLNK